MENWKRIGMYDVSNYGIIRNVSTGNVLKQEITKRGYRRVVLYLNGEPKHFQVHRLVWEAFNGPIPDGYEIDHINGIKNDNRLENLRCVTPYENTHNPVTRPKHLESTRMAHNKPVLQINRNTGEIIKKWKCIRDAERELGINHSGISDCCLNKRYRKSAGGFKWRFAS